MLSNDHDPAQRKYHPDSPDSHGHAALLLVESLIHGLCESETLSAREAVAITERAADVQQDHAEAADGAGAPLWRGHALLMGIKASLSMDLGGPRPVPG